MAKAKKVIGHRTLGITIIAALMIIFGLAEIATGFTHNFFGISTANTLTSTIVAVIIGGFYLVAGLLILTMRRLAAEIAIVLLIADIVGRIGLVVVGFYPINSTEQDSSIIIGTAIAAIFAAYIWLKLKLFA